MQSYKFKYVCINCNVVYWGYRPRDERCKECGRKSLYKVEMEKKKMASDLDLSVDPNKLVDEWSRHVPMVFTWHRRLAEAQSELDVAKSAYDLAMAEVDSEIREDPSAYDISKVTNDAITNAALRQPEIKAAIKSVNDCKAKVNKAQAAVNALQDRKKQLSMLTELWMRDYYSDVEIPEEVGGNRVTRKSRAKDADDDE